VQSVQGIKRLDPTVIYRTMLAFTVLHQGKPDLGAELIRNSLQYAKELKSPYNVSYAHELAAQYHATTGQRPLALEHAEAAAALAGEHGFVIHAAVAKIVRGWALDDIGVLRAGIAAYEGAGQYVGTSLFRALLVGVLLAQGEVQYAAVELTAIFAFVERSGERRHLAELQRLEAECMPEGGRRGALETGLATARAHGARLWELRAAVSLWRLERSNGDGRQTCRLLEDALHPFTDECDLPDVLEARALNGRAKRDVAGWPRSAGRSCSGSRHKPRRLARK
jgi:hypothetical protein